MFRVIKEFRDIPDNWHLYKVGDVYPREGVNASETHLNALLSRENNLHEPLIAEEKKPKKRASTKK